ncbi:hypothetical protein IT570_12485 [Candidatus Sumerlaeota bacterium]|nr:hypothetical protein [Candidatus Sumerlaeota bacterium]
MSTETQDRVGIAIPAWLLIVAAAALFPLLLTLGFKQFTADDYWFAGHANMLEGKPSGSCSVWASFSGDWLTGRRGHGGWLRPITRLSWWLNDITFTIRRPWGYHLTNALFHAGNAVLCALLAHLLITRDFRKKVPWRSASLAPLLAGFFFAWFPPSAGAVSWVSGRTDLLAVFFVLLAMVIAVVARRARPVSIILTTVLACLSKESGFVAPLFIASAIVIANRRIFFFRGQAINVAASFGTALLAFVYRWFILGAPGGYAEQSQHLGVVHLAAWMFFLFGGVVITALLAPLHVGACFLFVEISAIVLLAQRWPRERLRAFAASAIALLVMIVAAAATVVNLPVTEIEGGRLVYFAAVPVALGVALLYRVQESLRPRYFFILPFAIILLLSAYRFSSNDRAWTHSSQMCKSVVEKLLVLAGKNEEKPFVVLYDDMNIPTYEQGGLHKFEDAKLLPWDQAKWAIYRESRGRREAQWGLHAIHIPTGARVGQIHADNPLNIQYLDASPASVTPLRSDADGSYLVDLHSLFAGKKEFQYVCVQVEATTVAPLPPLVVNNRELHPMPSITDAGTPTWFYAMGIFPASAQDRFRLPPLDKSVSSTPARVSVVTFPMLSLE